VLVAGASGALGGEICRRLIARGVPVHGLVRPSTGPEARQVLQGDGVRLVEADLEDPSTLAAAVEGAGCVVSTATSFPLDGRPDAIERVDRDGAIALVDAAESAAVTRFVYVSFKPVPLDFPLQDAKRAVEERLARSALATVVLRPGKFMDIWFSPLCGFDVAAARVAVFGEGTSPVTWIARSDVAEVAAMAAIGDQVTAGMLELGGPEALDQRDVIALFEDAVGRPFELETIPAAELRRRYREAATAVERSLAALMLEAVEGAVTPMEETARALSLRLTSVAEFAREHAET
jgi:uncharacterized protein YbjT (DUF2867 family)